MPVLDPADVPEQTGSAYPPPLDRRQAGVGGDRVEPGAQRAPTLEAAQSAPSAEQGVLECVLRVVDRPEHPVAMCMELRSVRLDEAPEGLLVASASGLEQLALPGGCGLGGHRSPDLRPSGSRALIATER